MNFSFICVNYNLDKNEKCNVVKNYNELDFNKMCYDLVRMVILDKDKNIERELNELLKLFKLSGGEIKDLDGFVEFIKFVNENVENDSGIKNCCYISEFYVDNKKMI